MGNKWASEKMEEIYKTKIHEKITILEDCYSLNTSTDRYTAAAKGAHKAPNHQSPDN